MCVRVRAGILEVAVVLYTRRGASRRRAVTSAAAVRRVRGVSVQVGRAGALAAEREAGAVVRPLQGRGAVRTEVDVALRRSATLVVGNPHREVVPDKKSERVE